MDANLTTLLFIYRVSAWRFGRLKYFVGERSLDPPPHLAATDLNMQVEDFFTVLKFIFSTQRSSFSAIVFLILNLLLHAYRLERQSEA